MSGNFSNRDSNDNAAPQVPAPPPVSSPVEAASLKAASLKAATKRGRPRIYPDAKVRRREYMREYRKGQKAPRGTFKGQT